MTNVDDENEVKEMEDHPKIVIFGAGAIGGSFGAWIAEHFDNIYFVARGENEKAFRKNGLTTYQADHPDSKVNVPIKVISSIQEVPDADLVVIGVKNFSLETVAREIKQSTGDRPIIVGLQNGVANETILPKYFSKVIYGVVGYNAWIDEPGVIGYQKKRPLIIGTKDNELIDEMKKIALIFNLGVETRITDRLRDAAHTKLVVNLANSLTTLVGLNVVDIPESSMKLFQKLFASMLFEGTKIVKAAQVREYKIEGLPTWRQIWLLAHLPVALTGRRFQQSTKNFYISSMAQDIIQRGGMTSELESINGYLLRLAKKYGVKAPVNQAIYELCKTSFSKPGFKPLSVEEITKKMKLFT